ncbi:MAG: alpha/beta hydrolase, partial [Anaerolineaceae bacterium]|nr:alpha/beta hydrolase [Anaerolineaceae bacterium]
MSILKAVHVYKEVKGCPIKADVFLPAAENPPVVLFFHGGALISGSRKHLPGYQVSSLNRAGLAV